jgi:hypothetical protein
MVTGTLTGLGAVAQHTLKAHYWNGGPPFSTLTAILPSTDAAAAATEDSKVTLPNSCNRSLCIQFQLHRKHTALQKGTTSSAYVKKMKLVRVSQGSPNRQRLFP